MKDFSEPRPDKGPTFTVDGDVFECVPVLPGATIAAMARLSNTTDPAKQLSEIADVLEMTLVPASAELFASRWKDTERPITMAQVAEIVKWVMTEYSGGRPTSAPSDGSAGHGSNGTGSTGGLHIAELIP